MTIQPWELDMGYVNKRVFTSRFGSESYQLVDFKWEPDEKEQLSFMEETLQASV